MQDKRETTGLLVGSQSLRNKTNQNKVFLLGCYVQIEKLRKEEKAAERRDVTVYKRRSNTTNEKP